MITPMKPPAKYPGMCRQTRLMMLPVCICPLLANMPASQRPTPSSCHAGNTTRLTSTRPKAAKEARSADRPRRVTGYRLRSLFISTIWFSTTQPFAAYTTTPSSITHSVLCVRYHTRTDLTPDNRTPNPTVPHTQANSYILDCTRSTVGRVLPPCTQPCSLHNRVCVAPFPRIACIGTNNFGKAGRSSPGNPEHRVASYTLPFGNVSVSYTRNSLLKDRASPTGRFRHTRTDSSHLGSHFVCVLPDPMDRVA